GVQRSRRRVRGPQVWARQGCVPGCGSACGSSGGARDPAAGTAWRAGDGVRTGPSRAGLAACVGLQAMAGSPELSGAGILLALLFAWNARSHEPDWRDLPRRRRLLVCVACVVLGLALAAWALVPMGGLAPSSHPGP